MSQHAYGQMDPEGTWPTGADYGHRVDWKPLPCNDHLFSMTEEEYGYEL